MEQLGSYHQWVLKYIVSASLDMYVYGDTVYLIENKQYTANSSFLVSTVTKCTSINGSVATRYNWLVGLSPTARSDSSTSFVFLLQTYS